MIALRLACAPLILAAALLGFGELTLTGHGGPLLTAAIVLGIATNLEGLAASLLFREWHHDVPTFWHAMRIERARQ